MKKLLVALIAGAIVLLAGLADSNRQLLRSAATGEWVGITARGSASCRDERVSLTPGPLLARPVHRLGGQPLRRLVRWGSPGTAERAPQLSLTQSGQARPGPDHVQ